MEKPIKFGIGVLDFSRKRGGAEGYLVNLCAQLLRENYEVHVYAERWDEESDGQFHFHSVKTIPFSKSLRLLSFARRATREIKSENYDITFGVGNTLAVDVLQPHGGVHWAWFWRSLEVYGHPVLRTLKFLGRVLSPKQWVQGWIEDAPYRQKNLPRIIAISDMVKQDMMNWYGIPEEKIVVVYNGVDKERFHPRNRIYRDEIRRRHGVGNEIVLLFVSNNFRMKGLGYLMQALAALKKERETPFMLLILGRDRQGPYQSLAKALGLSRNVIFAGATEEPEKYYGASDLLVHPTFYDACSLTVIEALASGLPVITTSYNGASGLVRRGKNGWVIERPEDTDQLKRVLSLFFESHQQSAPARHEEACGVDYSEKRNLDQMLDLFKEVLRGKSPSY